jgi:hypothetical protein
MSLVATPMTEPKKPEYCRYAAAKVDAELVNLAHAAARLEGKTFQEWLSDLVNESAAKALGRRPIKRKPPKPRSKP